MVNKELRVSAIRNGTVIDRIPADRIFRVVEILNIKALDTQITIGINFDSRKLGKKGIIKVTEKFPSVDDINKIAMLAPMAKINIIKDFEVVDKKRVEIPEEISGIAKCINPKCITNHENVVTKFKVISGEEVSLKCHYCEKIIKHEDFVI